MTTASPHQVPALTPARYGAPSITVGQVTRVIPSEPIDGPHRSPGHYQHILLNTHTGRLSFHENTQHREPRFSNSSSVPPEVYRRWYPGVPFTLGGGPHQWFNAVPEVIDWLIDSGVEELPYLDVDAANGLLQELAPHAQHLLEQLFDAGGDLDWSAEAARTGRNIHRLCTRRRAAAPPEADADLVDFGHIVRAYPHVYRPEFLGLSLEKLAAECESFTRFLGSNEHWHLEVKERFGRATGEGADVRLEVTGVRAWYRTVLLNGDPRTLIDFTTFDADGSRLSASGITSTSTDACLDAWTAREDAYASAHGLRLAGVRGAATKYRDDLRARDWDRLAVVGAEVVRLEELRTERQVLVMNAIAWGSSDADIAGQAGVTKQAVNKMRPSEPVS